MTLSIKLFIGCAILLIAVFQYYLWFGSGGIREMHVLKTQLESKIKENEKLRMRNQSLMYELADIRDNKTAIEARARYDLGMVKKGETFYQITQEKH